MRSTIVLAYETLMLSAAFAQSRPDVTDILKKVSETYQAVTQYELDADVTALKPGTRTPVAGHTIFAFKAPDRYRMEGSFPGISTDSSGFDGTVIVYDGSAVWCYMPKSNQYISLPAKALTVAAPDDGHDLSPESVDSFTMGRYRKAVDFAHESTLLREETIDYAGAKVDCYIVSVSEKARGFVYTWWVDTKRYLVLREDDAWSSAVFTTIKLGEPLLDELFKFEPPPGATRVEPDR